MQLGPYDRCVLRGAGTLMGAWQRRFSLLGVGVGDGSKPERASRCNAVHTRPQRSEREGGWTWLSLARLPTVLSLAACGAQNGSLWDSLCLGMRFLRGTYLARSCSQRRPPQVLQCRRFLKRSFPALLQTPALLLVIWPANTATLLHTGISRSLAATRGETQDAALTRCPDVGDSVSPGRI